MTMPYMKSQDKRGHMIANRPRSLKLVVGKPRESTTNRTVTKKGTK